MDGHGPGEVLVVQDQYHTICTGCGCLKLMRLTKRPVVCRRYSEKAVKLSRKVEGKGRARAMVSTVR